MATNDVHLYIGYDEQRFSFPRDSKDWREVKDQIQDVVKAGRGLITIPRQVGGRSVYVYSSALPVRWVEERS